MSQVMMKGGVEKKRAEGAFAAAVLRAFMECSDEVRKIVMDMLGVMTSPESDEDEREAASLTFMEALFPDNYGDPGIELAADLECPQGRAVAEGMKAQERTFAQRLDALMKEKDIDQTELAKRAGVGQPAISMMLARECRPQRRTVEKLSNALAVEPDKLWPLA